MSLESICRFVNKKIQEHSILAGASIPSDNHQSISNGLVIVTWGSPQDIVSS